VGLVRHGVGQGRGKQGTVPGPIRRRDDYPNEPTIHPVPLAIAMAVRDGARPARRPPTILPHPVTGVVT